MRDAAIWLVWHHFGGWYRGPSAKSTRDIDGASRCTAAEATQARQAMAGATVVLAPEAAQHIDAHIATLEAEVMDLTNGRRITDLLEANNALVERARKAEAEARTHREFIAMIERARSHAA